MRQPLRSVRCPRAPARVREVRPAPAPASPAAARPRPHSTTAVACCRPRERLCVRPEAGRTELRRDDWQLDRPDGTGGLLYHFPSTTALRDGLIARALHDTDEALRQAAAAGQAGRAWLRLSVPDEDQRRLRAGLLATFRLVGADAALPPQVVERAERWQQLLTDELGDAMRAQVLRLVGDRLLLRSLSGIPPAAAPVEALADHLLGGPS